VASIYAMAAEFRAELLRQDRDAARRMASSWTAAVGGITSRARELMEELRALVPGTEEGLELSMRIRRLQLLEQQAREEMERWSRIASGTIEGAQRDAARLGLAAGEQMLTAQVGGAFDRLPVEAVEELAGLMGDGTPIHRVLSAHSQMAAEGVRRVLTASLAVGDSPRLAAVRIRAALAMPLGRAMVIARTETMRAWRESSRRLYEANSEVVQGWRWVAARSVRTCPMCLAMDGREFPLGVHMGTHPNCRCVMVPVTQATPPLRETGEEWLRRQPPDVQDSIMGRAKAEAWRDGRIGLEDLVGFRIDDDWGHVRWELSLRDALANAAGREPGDAPPGAAD
jgi:SPP1 gp7 family putative phage head morphogenesis protein